MTLKKFLYSTFFTVFFGYHYTFASQDPLLSPLVGKSKDHSSPTYSLQPLEEHEFLEIIKDFYLSEYNKAIHSPSVLNDSPILLDLKMVIPTHDQDKKLLSRKTNLSVWQITDIDGIDHRLHMQEVGLIILIENPHLLDHKGPFHLELLYIYDSFCGKGLGPKALQYLTNLAKTLCTKSSFYQTISLLASDVVHEGIELPIIPKRVKFYLDNGFSLHPKTQQLMYFLSLKHFIDHFDIELFMKYLKDYDLVDATTHHKTLKSYASSILKELKEDPSIPSLTFGQILEYVKTHASVCAIQILDRAYYDCTVSDEEQEHFDKYLYFMTKDVLKDSCFTTTSHKSSPFIPQLPPSIDLTYLEAQPWNNKYHLLPDQLSLNKKIWEMIANKGQKKKSQPKKRKRQGNSIKLLSKGPKVQKQKGNPLCKIPH